MKRGHIGIALLALAVAAAIAYGFMPRPVAVDSATIAKGHLAVTVEEEGKTRVRERYVLSAPVAGFARRIALKVGDPVQAGQVVAVIEPTRAASLDPRSRAQAEAQVRAAQATLAAARDSARATAAEERLAEQDLARASALNQAKFVAQAAVDQASARLQASRATRQASEQNIRVAEHQVTAARATLAQASRLASGGAEANVAIASPVTGRVLAVGHESEGSVLAGQAMLEVGNPESLEVVVELLSTSAVKLAPGSRVRLDRWGGDPPLDGVVRMVEPAGFTKVSALGVEEQRVRVLCDLTTPRERWRQLGDGYRVEASFVLWQGDDLVLAPTSALFRHGDGWAVFVMADGRARLRPVQVGQRNGLAAQILSGLKVGEVVIARPDDRIREGVRVAAREKG